MEKLTFYVLSSPEKLDRIGEYLAHRVARDIYRRRIGFIMISIDVMDQLLVTCHSQMLNLYVESFLKSLQKLLEYPNYKLQIMAAQSFVKFANIEEDAPSYHLRYDFFMSHFASMCQRSISDINLNTKLRRSGLQGLQGVIRKTVSDELVENIWSEQHMDKIVPPLLFNIQEGFKNATFTSDIVPEDEQLNPTTVSPPLLAESCLRELIERAALVRVNIVLKPILKYLDNNSLWDPNDFAIHIFHVVSFSVQVQYSYVVVQVLIAHLDHHNDSNISMRIGIADVLQRIIAIAAKDCLGPSVLEIINSLVNHLGRIVIGNSPEDTSQKNYEERYQDILINALASYTHHLPDYQKIEIMKFISTKLSQDDTENSRLQNILLRSILQVGCKFHTNKLISSLEPSLLIHLLRHANSTNSETRLLVQQIFHVLLDRNGNVEILKFPILDPRSANIKLKNAEARGDYTFFRKQGLEILDHLYHDVQNNNNTIAHVDAFFTTFSLLSIELNCVELSLIMIRILLSLQDNMISTSKLTRPQRLRIHALISSLMCLQSFLLGFSELENYVYEVIDLRKKEAPYFLPPLKDKYGPVNDQTVSSALLFNRDKMCNILQSCGLETSGIEVPYQSIMQVDYSLVNRSYSADISVTVQEPDSVSSSPSLQKKLFSKEEINYESLKNVMNEPLDKFREAERIRQDEISRMFATTKFTDLVARIENKGDVLQDCLKSIFAKNYEHSMDADHFFILPETCKLVF